MSKDNSTQTLIYVASFVGMLGFLGIFGEFLRRKHRKEVKERSILLEAVRQRQQQVIDENLPPFYVDHIRDPIVMNDEVPLEAIIGIPLEHPAEAPIVPEVPHSSPTATTAAATTITTASNAAYRDTVIIVPESTSTELTVLLPPPSYDVPNLVVERSPMMESDARMASEGYFSPSPPSSSNSVHPPSTSSSLSQPSTPQSPEEQSTAGQELDAPRYSAEFSPHIPHERHLDNYRRSRALSDAALGPPPPQNLLTASSAEAMAV